MHVYPRTFTPRIGPYEFKFPKWKLIIGDLLIHQFPLYRMIRQNYTSIVCGIYLLLPALTNISITTSKLVDAWLTWLKSIGGRSEKTIISYRNDLQKFLSFMSNHFQDNVSPETLKNGSHGLPVIEFPNTWTL